MKNIFVPLGISTNAKQTLSYAIDFAHHVDADLFVMDSYHPSFKNAHILNAKEAVERNNQKRIKEMIQGIDTKKVSIRFVAYDGDFLSGVAALDQEVGIDLVVTAPTPNSSDTTIFLGSTAGSLVKKTNLPVLIVPEEESFSVPKRALFAFKHGQIEGEKSLQPVHFFQKKFEVDVNLLLVKIPGQSRADQQIDHEIVELSNDMTSTENATVYQGVLEHFSAKQPDLLFVFARKRGFFEKLIASDIVYKKDFFTKKPLLVLKNRK